MGTDIRAEISQKSPYWIPKHRYYELKHFCLQYPEWRHELQNIDGLERRHDLVRLDKNDGRVSKPTEVYAEARLYFEKRINMVVHSANKATNDIFANALVQAVTNGWSYEQTASRGLVNCGKEVWYAAYRRFFWILDKTRK